MNQSFFENKLLSNLIIVATLIAISFLFYAKAIDNFFAWDDFLWLYRGKILPEQPLEMFHVDNNYFDTVVYILFWANYEVFGTDATSYHIIDILIHSINALLVFCLVLNLTKNRGLAFVCGLIFATSFSVATAVIWPSARVDLLATLFALSSLILFVRYVENADNKIYVLSVFTFVLAIFSKITAIILPLWILATERNFYRERQIFLYLTPFILLSFVYFIAVLSFSSSIKNQFENIFLQNRFQNFLLSLSCLFVPHEYIKSFNFLIYLIPLVAIAFVFFIRKDSIVFGFILMIIGLIPILGLSSVFTLAGENNHLYYILGTPSHRIYMASVGSSILIGSIMFWSYNNIKQILLKNCFLSLLMAALLTLNFFEIGRVEKIWDVSSKDIKMVLDKTKKLQPDIRNKSTIIFFNSPMSSAFAEPMFKIFYGNNSINFEQFKVLPGTISSKKVNVNYSSNTYAFVRGLTTIHDVTSQYKNAMESVIFYKYAKNKEESDKYKKRYESAALKINEFIMSGK